MILYVRLVILKEIKNAGDSFIVCKKTERLIAIIVNNKIHICVHFLVIKKR